MLPAGREGEGTSVGRGMSSVQKVDIEANLWGPLRSGEWRGGGVQGCAGVDSETNTCFLGPRGQGEGLGLTLRLEAPGGLEAGEK